RSYVEIAAELDCSLNFLYRQFGAQKERAQREPVRSPLRLSPAKREEISRDLQAAFIRNGWPEYAGFLNDPMFLASTLYLKSLARSMALLKVMTSCLPVYAAV